MPTTGAGQILVKAEACDVCHTGYKVIKEAAIKHGDWIVAPGATGLGRLAIQYAKAVGLHVCVVSIDYGKLAHAY